MAPNLRVVSRSRRKAGFYGKLCSLKILAGERKHEVRGVNKKDPSRAPPVARGGKEKKTREKLDGPR